MSKHYRINEQEIIDLEKHEMRVFENRIHFTHTNDPEHRFYIPFDTPEAAAAEFEKICRILTGKDNSSLFYEVHEDITINLREVKAININTWDKENHYIYFYFDEQWYYRKTFPADDNSAEKELKRLKELLAR